MKINPIIATDSYKVSHYKQYPPGTAYVHSYFECRGLSDMMDELMACAEVPHPREVVFFGALQYYFDEYLGQPIDKHDIAEAAEVFTAHFGNDDLFNRKGWERIVNKHGGYLPLRIRAVPEGTRVPLGNVLLTAENTDDELPWLTNYLETRLSHIWYPVTVATLSYCCRQIITRWLKKNGSPETIGFKLHDFGYRGATCEQASAVGGLAHLVNFMGTDTMSALLLGRKFYHCNMAGFSIPAAEHSTITSWAQDCEVHAFANMLRQYPTGPVAVVSDSYDIYNACEKLWGDMLRKEVLDRDGTLIIRPDSGEPSTVILKCLNILSQRFGSEENAKGRRVLNPKVRLIQGDGVTPLEIDEILDNMDYQGWSADNIAFGMGGGLLQRVNRDDLKCAFKCSAIQFLDGRLRGVWKNPVTDPGKTSKSGILSLYSEASRLYTAERGMKTHPEVMQTVFEDGQVLIKDSLDAIRNRAYQPANQLLEGEVINEKK